MSRTRLRRRWNSVAGGRVGKLSIFSGALLMLVLAAIVLQAPEFGPIALLIAIAGVWLHLLAVASLQRGHLRSLEKKVNANYEFGRRLELPIRNTAGSVGRLAPLVREISRNMGSRWVPQTTRTGVHSLPPAPMNDIAPNNKSVTAMTVADRFTLSALGYEWHQLEPTPDNWQQLLEQNDVNLLFVESAWEGNDGAWRYSLTGSSAPRQAVVDMVMECRSRGIPTVFWNKEDPPHFSDFLETARLFDWVFTTEERLIDSYREELGHDRVAVLPFAASPFIHNPAKIGEVQRNKASIFGGMYFRHKYPERREQMDYLLPAAAAFGLDIFSRQLGGDVNYQFPDSLQRHVRGELAYPQMISAYHAYKVVLNVNSVPDSKSMCARRIFEATACGAAVVTADTPAVSEFFGEGEISVVSSEVDAKPTIRSLLRSDAFRERRVHLAQRRIWENHTYTHRVNQVLEHLDLPLAPLGESVSIVVSTVRPQCLETIIRNFARQSWVDKELVLLTHGFEPDPADLRRITDNFLVENLTVLSADSDSPLGGNLNRLTSAAQGTFVVRMDDDDWYGRHYVRDLVNAARYSQAELVGKAASYIYFEGLNATILSYGGHEHRYTDFVRGATFAGPRETFREIQFPHIRKSEDSGFIASLLGAGGKVYSADRFNFLVRRNKDKTRHTWDVTDVELFGSGNMAFVGEGLEQIEI